MAASAIDLNISLILSSFFAILELNKFKLFPLSTELVSESVSFYSSETTGFVTTGALNSCFGMSTLVSIFFNKFDALPVAPNKPENGYFFLFFSSLTMSSVFYTTDLVSKSESEYLDLNISAYLFSYSAVFGFASVFATATSTAAWIAFVWFLGNSTETLF